MAQPVAPAVLLAATGLTPVTAESPNAERIEDLYWFIAFWAALVLLAVVESFDPRSARWRAVPPVPGKRGGTAAAAVAGRLVSAGGEEPGGTIATVFAYSPRTRRWARLPRLRTARHGLGLVGWRGRAYALAGGPQPGLTVSGANEVLTLARPK